MTDDRIENITIETISISDVTERQLDMLYELYVEDFKESYPMLPVSPLRPIEETSK